MAMNSSLPQLCYPLLANSDFYVNIRDNLKALMAFTEM
jgi:hypothetical protein